MATVLITGGTGLIGTALSKELHAKGYEVIIVSRSPEKYPSRNSGVSYAKWDLEKMTIAAEAIFKADYIVHLAGAGIADKRWTLKRKREIVESRTQSSALLVKALKENVNHVKAVICASAVGWYGASAASENETENGHSFIESDPAADDFLGTTCQQWEVSIDPVLSLGKRIVKFRTGIVLSNQGGALKEFKKPLRFGFATILGNGKQIMSWIHIDDIVRLYIYAIENERLHGVYNAVAPHPVTNKKFMLQLARSLRGKFFVPFYVPSFILEAVFGELSIEVLKNAPVSCKKIKKEGYQFTYPSITAALHQLNNRNLSPFPSPQAEKGDERS